MQTEDVTDRYTIETEDVTDRYTIEYHASTLLIAGRARPSGWLICDWEANDYIRYGSGAIRAWNTRADTLDWIESGTDVYPAAP